MNQLVLGKFIPGSSPLHRLDPRAKILFVFTYMTIVFLANNAVTYGLLLAFTGIGIFFSRVPLLIVIKAMKPVFFLIILTIILHLWMTQGGAILLEIPFVTIYEEGLRQAIFISFRFILLMSMALLLTFTTAPIDLTDGMERLLKPFQRFGLPAHELALMMSIALRFIPTLWEETEKIKKAQMARGADFEKGNIFRRVESYVPVLIPLFISAFRRADELAMAMESRCYRGGTGRTRLRESRFTKLDLCLLFIIVGLFTGLWLLRD